MPVNPDHIEQLVLEKISGIITPENDAALEKLLKEEPEAMAIWQKINATFPPSFLEELRQDVASSKLVDKIVNAAIAEGKRRKRVKKLKPLLIPTGIAAIAFIFFFIQAHERRQTLLMKEQDSLMQAEFVTLIRYGQDPIYINEPTDAIKSIEEIKNNISQGVTISANIENSPRQEKPAKRKNIYAGKDGFNIYTVNGHLECDGGEEGEMVMLKTPVGKRCTIRLPDGTLMMMNDRTKIQMPLTFRQSTRNISLNGEAFLKVAHDPAHPFIISVPEAEIRVLGTSLNVNSYDSTSMQVALTEGKVNFSNASADINLSPGHVINFGLNKKPEQEPLDSAEVLGWQTGKYQFNGTPLQQVMDIIHIEYGIRIIFDNQEVTRNKLFAYLDIHKPLPDFMENIRIAGVCRFFFKGAGMNQELHIY